jgi:hypothetical protein
MAESLHISHWTQNPWPMPITLYPSEEILMDEGFSDREIAELFTNDLEFAVNFYRERLRKEHG